MDPDVTLRELQDALTRYADSRQLLGREADLDALWKALVAADHLAQHAENLTDWLARGGFPPQAVTR